MNCSSAETGQLIQNPSIKALVQTLCLEKIYSRAHFNIALRKCANESGTNRDLEGCRRINLSV